MSELSLLRDVRKLIKFVYNINFQPDEKFGLQSQIRRAVVSVALNIREGNVFDKKNKLRFFKIALGSLVEVDECMAIITDLGNVAFYTNGMNLGLDDYHKFHETHYWKCLNKLKSVIIVEEFQ